MESVLTKTETKTKLKESPFCSVHLTADFISPKVFIEDAQELEDVLYGAALAANNTPLKAVVHKFPVQGITGVILLAESHISVHTWPEHDYVAIDIFTCGEKTQPLKALEYLKKKFLPEKVKFEEVIRGKI
ncbi:MAG: adenosylmethionine decarboxylase [Candidatus Omnitrophica bacterium]|jgi:S-adenosylmethionine decarboxylase|nr:adenosylmethionine decarboxylase [Candidatus Omnitrophota bacterium]